VVLRPKRLRSELRARRAQPVYESRIYAQMLVLGYFEIPFRLKTSFGGILGQENTFGSSASETAPARTSRAPYATCVRKHNLRVDARFRLFRDSVLIENEFWGNLSSGKHFWWLCIRNGSGPNFARAVRKLCTKAQSTRRCAF